ncbi:MAG TPA: hypothetical protein ENK38_05175 [Gammaproteobacteria bacterium]|nr:hypothetical protein [Gammaproteobacteria bacterium]
MNCPTCGAPVRVYSGGEGTNSHERLETERIVELEAQVAEQQAEIERLKNETIHDPNGHGALILSLQNKCERLQKLCDERGRNMKKHAVDFYRWWHNQPGTNTDQGYDTWIGIPDGEPK